MKTSIIVDLDGTLCDINHRLHLIQGETPDWERFYLNCEHDAMYHDMVALVLLLQVNTGINIHVITSRSDNCVEETEEWLEDHGIQHQTLSMREQGDFRGDFEVKKDLLINLEKYHGVSPESNLMILEDSDRCVRMYRDKGYRVLQVEDGSF